MDAFKTERLWVSPGTDDEIPDTFDTSGMEDVNQFLEALTQELLDTIRSDIYAVQDLIARMSKFSKDEDRQVFIARNLDGNVVGYIGVNYSHSNAPELQIEIAEPLWHQGYGTELLSGFLNAWEYSADFEAFTYHVRSGNEPSIRLVEKVGGILQPARSKAEEILLRTYHIEKMEGKP